MAYQAANRNRLRLPPAPASSLGFRHSCCYSWAGNLLGALPVRPLQSASLRPFICGTLRNFDARMWWALDAPLSPRLRAPLQCFCCFRGTFTCPFPLSSATIAGSLERRNSASIHTAVLLPVIPTPLRNRVSTLGYLVLHPPLSPLARHAAPILQCVFLPLSASPTFLPPTCHRLDCLRTSLDHVNLGLESIGILTLGQPIAGGTPVSTLYHSQLPARHCPSPPPFRLPTGASFTYTLTLLC
ncbi:hypothetical protein FB451DRAFT_1387446 [Mycena latifolia]|nr:hypothetical protein FB451DRAFT_1387446 [Mycena latifolia]